MHDRLERLVFRIAVAAIGATMAWFTFSRLSFAPVPWPDGSAFYLPSLDLIAWPPAWKMHSQAAFVPTYDQVNFNMMPIVPFLLGMGTRLGLGPLLGPALAIKFISLLALAAWAFSTLRLLPSRSRTELPLLVTTVGLAALFDPIARWGTLVVRSETWIGLLWVWILLEFVRASRKNRAVRPWLISILLGIGAYIHFEAIILVPAVAVGLAPGSGGLRGWWKRLWSIGWRTTLLLSPWFLYALANFPIFLEQMNTQFHRLEGGNSWIRTPYGFFHSLFFSHGNPVGWPKFFNLAKGMFWLLILALAPFTVWLARRRRIEDRGGSAPALAAMTCFFVSVYLWCTKPELWFTTLCHLALWPWLAVVLADSRLPKAAYRGLVAAAGIYALLSFGTAIQQQIKIPSNYSWQTYERWIDCIDRTISEHGQPGTPRAIWQPHVPDLLVELSSRHPDWDLTRTMDFRGSRHLAWELTKRIDALIYTHHAPNTGEYSGPLREQDRRLLRDEVEVPFGPWLLDRFPVEQPGKWSTKICENGPFWAAVALR